MLDKLLGISELDSALDDITGGLEDALSERPLNVDKIKKLTALRVRLAEAQRIAKVSLIGHKGKNNGIMSHIIR